MPAADGKSGFVACSDAVIIVVATRIDNEQHPVFVYMMDSMPVRASAMLQARRFVRAPRFRLPT
jgi:hypothetical protein